MGHYHEQMQQQAHEQEEQRRQRLYHKAASGWFDPMLETAARCQSTFVMMPLEEARRMITIMKEFGVAERLKNS